MHSECILADRRRLFARGGGGARASFWLGEARRASLFARGGWERGRAFGLGSRGRARARLWLGEARLLLREARERGRPFCSGSRGAGARLLLRSRGKARAPFCSGSRGRVRLFFVAKPVCRRCFAWRGGEKGEGVRMWRRSWRGRGSGSRWLRLYGGRARSRSCQDRRLSLPPAECGRMHVRSY